MNDPVCEKHVAGAPRLAAIVEEQFSEDDQEPQEESDSSNSDSESGDPYAIANFSDEFIDALYDEESMKEVNASVSEQFRALFDSHSSDNEYTTAEEDSGHTSLSWIGHAHLNQINESDIPLYDDEYNSHDEGVLDFTEYIQSIQEDPNEEGCFYATVDPNWKHIIINGIKCFALFDTGSTADIISPDFATVAKIYYFQLKNPVTLQLGTKGSRSKINYGCKAKFHLGDDKISVSGEDYFDIVNIDRYDMVVGCAFMRKYKISVNLEHDVIEIAGKPISTIPVGEEQAEIIRRSSKQVSEETKALHEYKVSTFDGWHAGEEIMTPACSRPQISTQFDQDQ
uniref:Uncharacterized protein n=1 Tax=Moniliophthora roreri TaxID=221103 RepID=A0A0W0FW37_MONRR